MNADARSQYERWYARAEGAGNLEKPWYRLVQRHVRADRDLEGARVLDIGCGRGTLSRWAAEQPVAARLLAGADFSAGALRLARDLAAERGAHAIQFVRMDIQAIAALGGSFDTIICCLTIAHVPRPMVAMRELARVMRSGGRLFLASPNYFGPLGVKRLLLRLTGRAERLRGPLPESPTMLPSLVRAVRRAGLQVEEIHGEGHYVPIPGVVIDVSNYLYPRALFRWFARRCLVVARKP